VLTVAVLWIASRFLRLEQITAGGH